MATFTPGAPTPRYARPPVIEVSAGLQFKGEERLQTRHFGEFWTSLAARYPHSEDRAPVPEALPEAEDARLVVLSMPPLRRMVMLSEDRSSVTQLQNDRFYHNWRKATPDTPYPHFGAVYGDFLHDWNAFKELARNLKVGSLDLVGWELTYINHIELAQDFAASVEKDVRLFRFSDLQTQFLSPPLNVTAKWEFSMPNQRGRGRASLSRARRAGVGLMVLTLSCTGLCSDRYTMDEWFGSAHEWVVWSFTELTTTDAHHRWGRTR